MTLPTESVTLAGSGLTFINSYDASVNSAYRGAIITAEHELQSHFTNQVTISASFSLASLGPGAAASNSFSELGVSYATLKSALVSHATSADDLLSVNGLPASDPSNGAGFAIALPEARILGLLPQTNSTDLHVTLNSNLAWSFGQDAVGAIEHELTEGGFGRFASLGFDGTRWMPLDLFRFTAAGVRDYTGGSDGVPTYFGLDGSHVSNLPYHNAINASGVFDGADLGDWGSTLGDAFGPGGPGAPGSLSATDLQVLDVLGWNTAPFAPAADDYASSISDTAHSFGTVAVGGTASGTLQQAGDHDWFRVTLQAGATYTITETGQHGGGGTLGDPYLALHDATGAQVAFNDDAVSGSNPDSSLSFTPSASGTYYVDAGAFVDGYAGSYMVGVTQTAAPVSPPPVSPPPVSPPPVSPPPVSPPPVSPPPVSPAPASPPTPGVSSSVAADATLTGGAGNDTLTGLGHNTISAGAGDDVISGAGGGNYLRGDDGNDQITGGPGFDDINGNKGDDTIDGGSGGADWLVGGQGNDLITAHSGGNILYGNIGNDTLQGGSGDELIRGGKGDDVLSGGAGNDWMSGDLGTNTLTGGTGADTFHGSAGGGYDLVTDFNYAEGDRVQLDAGTTYHLIQAGPDLVIDMGGSVEMVLKNTQLSSLGSDWIFTR